MATTSKKPAAAPTEAKPTAKKAVATKAPAAKKAPAAAKTAPPAVKAETPAAKAPTKKASAPKTKLKASTATAPVVTAEQRTHYVAVAAFYIAERRGFTLGNPAEDWLAAEAEVDRLIASGHFNT